MRISIKINFFLFVLFVLLESLFNISCQHSPTVIKSTWPVIADGTPDIKMILTEDPETGPPLLIDTRNPFDFHLSHAPSAINIQWRDLLMDTGASVGKMKKKIFPQDLSEISRRWALNGISPMKKIVVLGRGAQGDGEEGFVAWLLKYVGVREVYTLHFSQIKEQLPRESMPPKNAPYWQPVIQEASRISRDAFMKWAEKKPYHNISTVIDDKRTESVLIDVSDAGYLQIQKDHLNMKIFSIPWVKWVDSFSFLSKNINQELVRLGLRPGQHKIYVSGSEPMKSAYVAFFLQSLNFQTVWVDNF